MWGRTCARADLEALVERLLEVSSQHEARRLGQPSRQLELLDAHAGCDTQAMAAAWRARRAAEVALEAARSQAADAARHRLDLEDLVALADAAAVEPGEPEALQVESSRLRHLDELTAAAAAAAELLSPAEGEGAQALTARAGDAVAAAAAYEPGMATVAAERAPRPPPCGSPRSSCAGSSTGSRPIRAGSSTSRVAGTVFAARAPLRRTARAGAGDGRRAPPPSIGSTARRRSSTGSPPMPPPPASSPAHAAPS